MSVLSYRVTKTLRNRFNLRTINFLSGARFYKRVARQNSHQRAKQLVYFSVLYYSGGKHLNVLKLSLVSCLAGKKAVFR